MNQAMNDPILAQAEQKIESQLTPETRANYLKIVVAGMAVALEKGPDGILGSLKDSKDPTGDCAKGAVNLVLLLRRQAKGIMPLKAMVPAGMTLMLKALDVADKAGIMQVDADALVKATRIFADTMTAKLGISKQMLQNATVRVHAMTQDPVAMDKINQAAGVVKHPDASTPTPIPEASP